MIRHLVNMLERKRDFIFFKFGIIERWAWDLFVQNVAFCLLFLAIFLSLPCISERQNCFLSFSSELRLCSFLYQMSPEAFLFEAERLFRICHNSKVIPMCVFIFWNYYFFCFFVFLFFYFFIFLFIYFLIHSFFINYLYIRQ